MFGKLGDALDLFRKGSEVANKNTWKDAGTATPYVAGVLLAALKLAGDMGWVNVQLSLEQASTIAAGVSTAVLYIIHLISSRDAGLLPAKPAPAAMPATEPAKANDPLQGEHEANAQTSGIGDDTRGRAEAYLRDNKLFDERG